MGFSNVMALRELSFLLVLIIILEKQSKNTIEYFYMTRTRSSVVAFPVDFIKTQVFLQSAKRDPCFHHAIDDPWKRIKWNNEYTKQCNTSEDLLHKTQGIIC
jgi:hypothetical protein